jgi:hypothetical protein
MGMVTNGQQSTDSITAGRSPKRRVDQTMSGTYRPATCRNGRSKSTAAELWTHWRNGPPGVTYQRDVVLSWNSKQEYSFLVCNDACERLASFTATAVPNATHTWYLRSGLDRYGSTARDGGRLALSRPRKRTTQLHPLLRTQIPSPTHIPTGPVPPRLSCTTARGLYCATEKTFFLVPAGN